MARRLRVGQGLGRHDVIQLLEGHQGLVVQGVARVVAGTVGLKHHTPPRGWGEPWSLSLSLRACEESDSEAEAESGSESQSES